MVVPIPTFPSSFTTMDFPAVLARLATIPPLTSSHAVSPAVGISCFCTTPLASTERTSVLVPVVRPLRRMLPSMSRAWLGSLVPMPTLPSSVIATAFPSPFALLATIPSATVSHSELPLKEVIDCFWTLPSSSTVRISLLDPLVSPLRRAVPSTSSVSVGRVVPIPTFPSCCITILGVTFSGVAPGLVLNIIPPSLPVPETLGVSLDSINHLLLLYSCRSSAVQPIMPEILLSASFWTPIPFQAPALTVSFWSGSCIPIPKDPSSVMLMVSPFAAACEATRPPLTSAHSTATSSVCPKLPPSMYLTTPFPSVTRTLLAILAFPCLSPSSLSGSSASTTWSLLVEEVVPIPT